MPVGGWYERVNLECRLPGKHERLLRDPYLMVLLSHLVSYPHASLSCRFVHVNYWCKLCIRCIFFFTIKVACFLYLV